MESYGLRINMEIYEVCDKLFRTTKHNVKVVSGIFSNFICLILFIFIDTATFVSKMVKFLYIRDSRTFHP